MKFDRVKYSDLKLNDTDTVSKTYTTSVQGNNPQTVSITDDECKKSVQMLSRMSKRKKNKKIG